MAIGNQLGQVIAGAAGNAVTIGSNGLPADGGVNLAKLNARALDALARYGSYSSPGTSLKTGNVAFGKVAATLVSDGNYNAFPGVHRLPPGHLIAVYRTGTGHLTTDGIIKYQVSGDSGVTWSTPATAVANPGSSIDVRDPEILLTSDGRLLLSYFRWNGTNSTGIYLTTGTPDGNGGATWGSAVNVASTFTSWVACSSEIRETVAGTLLWPIYGRNSGDTTDRAAVLRSTNGGATWRQIAVAGSGSTNEYNEWNLIPLTNGHIVGILRHDAPSAAYARVVSTDDGQTWTSPADVMTVPICGRPALEVLDSGGIVLAARGVSGESAYHWTSWDEGLTWSYGTLFSGSNQVYASLVKISGGHVGMCVATESGGGGRAEVYYQDLTDGAGVFPGGNFVPVAPSPDPSTVPGLVAWYEARKIDGLADNDAAYTPAAGTGLLNDLSTSNNQLSNDNGVTFRKSVLNGAAAFRFNGTNQGLHRSSGVGTNVSSFTLYAVVRPAAIGAPMDLMMAGPATGGREWGITAGGVQYLNSANVATIGNSSTALQAGHWYRLCVRYNGGTGLAEFFINDVADGSGTSVQAFASGGLYLGSDVNVANWLNGDALIFLAYSVCHTDDQKATVQTYLKQLAGF